jgi:MYXO-CTERM domain-containing protein
MQFSKAGKAALMGAALVAMSPMAQAAQTTDTDGNRTTNRVQTDQDRDFPWGLLGLLGLAGLLGLKRKERDIVVDARRNP